jgi:3-hydroxy-9,10-secoandrosta-1,3,5(10)-triene-9,17-dione monooxygenase
MTAVDTVRGTLLAQRSGENDHGRYWRAAARALVPELRSHAARTDASREVADESFSALRGGGFFRLATPTALGGRGASVRTAVDVCAELARGCASSSWLVGIAYGGGLFASLMGDAVRSQVWGDDPDALVCGAANPSGTSRRVPSGLVLDGRWPWMSGVHHATWVLLGTTFPEQHGETTRGLALAPSDAVRVADTWRMAGMRGTGSNTAVAEDLYVPDSHIITFDKIASGEYSRRRPDEPRVNFPLSINLPLVGTVLGIAQGAMEHVVCATAGGKRGVSPLHARVADMPGHQMNIADAATLIDSGRLHARRAADELDRSARRGRRPDIEARARLRMDAAHAVRCARDAVDLLLTIGGAGSFADGSGLQQAWRDVETASRHAAFSLETSREIYGRVLMNAELPPSAAI